MVSHCCHSVNKETGCLGLPAERIAEKACQAPGTLWAGWLSSPNQHPYRLWKKQFYRTIKSESCHPLARDREFIPPAHRRPSQARQAKPQSLRIIQAWASLPAAALGIPWPLPSPLLPDFLLTGVFTASSVHSRSLITVTSFRGSCLSWHGWWLGEYTHSGRASSPLEPTKHRSGPKMLRCLSTCEEILSELPRSGQNPH